MKRVLQEGLLVAVVGATLAFAANAVSPRGLKLTRNYFPGGSAPHNPPTRPHTGAIVSPILPPTNGISPFVQLVAAFREKGLELVDSNRVVQLFHDPRYQQNLRSE